MSSMSKCYGTLPLDGSAPSHLIEEIGQVSDEATCQIFCKTLYHGICNWFMFDRTTNDCMLFSGSLNDLLDDCREVGYAREPNHELCDVVFPSNSSNGCYNFREDYCRFDFSLLDNLEDIDSLNECQLGCQYVNNCSYFLYDNPTKTCKLYTNESSRKICDIIHGTPEPDFNGCVANGYIPWASNTTDSTGYSLSTDWPAGQASTMTPMQGSNWHLGGPGESCDTVCTNLDLHCDADEMSNINNDSRLVKAAEDAGVTCKTLWDDTHPITPFYLASYSGRAQICEHLRNGAKSTCDATTSGPHQRFCFCQRAN